MAEIIGDVVFASEKCRYFVYFLDGRMGQVHVTKKSFKALFFFYDNIGIYFRSGVVLVMVGCQKLYFCNPPDFENSNMVRLYFVTF